MTAHRDLNDIGVDGISDADTVIVESAWGPLGDLPSATTVPSMDLDMVPEPLRAWAQDRARVACRPVESLVTALVASISALAGNRYGMQPFGDDYTIPTHLWALNIGPPGSKKTSILSDATAVLTELESGYAAAYKSQAHRDHVKLDKVDARIKKIKHALGSGDQSGDDHAALEAELIELYEEREGIRSGPERLTTSDATSEKLLDLVRENPAGIAIVRDEIVGTLEATTRKGQEGARTMYLQGADSQPYTQDRIGRGTITVPKLTLTLIGAAQPGAIKAYVEEAHSGRADGLLQRFQLTVWPGDRKTWTRPTGEPDKAARARVFTAAAWVAAFVRNSKSETIVTPHPDAQEFFHAWRDTAELRMCEGGDLMASSEAFQSHVAKHQRTMQALAAVFQLIEDADRQRKPKAVSLANAELAARWCAFLEVHARRLYGEDTDPSMRPARALANRIRSGDVVTGVSVRDVARREWSSLKGEDLKRAIRSLVDLNWVRTVEEATGGRPSARIILHPKLRNFEEGENGHDV